MNGPERGGADGHTKTWHVSAMHTRDGHQKMANLTPPWICGTRSVLYLPTSLDIQDTNMKAQPDTRRRIRVEAYPYISSLRAKSVQT